MISVWLVLVAISFIPWTIMVSLKENRSLLAKALSIGLFLATLSIFVENLGANLNLWVSKNSIFFLRAVPIEVFFIAFFCGTIYYIILKDVSWKISILSSVGIAIVWMAVEVKLVDLGYLVYFTNWNPILALISYFIAFMLVAGVTRYLRKN